jgi:hypothetical protein
VQRSHLRARRRPQFLAQPPAQLLVDLEGLGDVSLGGQHADEHAVGGLAVGLCLDHLTGAVSRRLELGASGQKRSLRDLLPRAHSKLGKLMAPILEPHCRLAVHDPALGDRKRSPRGGGGVLGGAAHECLSGLRDSMASLVVIDGDVLGHLHAGAASAVDRVRAELSSKPWQQTTDAAAVIAALEAPHGKLELVTTDRSGPVQREERQHEAPLVTYGVLAVLTFHDNREGSAHVYVNRLRHVRS